VQFDQLGLAPPLMRALERAEYTRPTPIQLQTIVPGLAGRDILGCAQTGTGKTAAFALPILQRLDAQRPDGRNTPIRALVLTPTRELAAQVAESFRTYGHFLDLRTTEIYGGVSERPQIDALRRGVDILVATPGRLLDLMGQGRARLGSVQILVLDEADRMLDMGFLPDIRRIVASVPAKRQTLLFSATLPREIRDLARGMLHSPVEVSVTPQSAAADTVGQCVYMVEADRKQGLLRELLSSHEVTRALVFTRTKHRADRVARALTQSGTPAEAIHGNKSQGARTRALRNFQTGATRVLVASDIASRGLDIDLVSHVFNFDLPNEPETYVHRIGRTGRAGASGLAVSFCDQEERDYLRDIERLLGRRVPVAAGYAAEPEPAPRHEPARRPAARSDGRVQRAHAPRREQGGRPWHRREARPEPVRRGDSRRAPAPKSQPPGRWSRRSEARTDGPRPRDDRGGRPRR
jgi:ATP-dependent RNA helicase RhlE